MRLIAALLALPLIEIALFVTLGGWLGLVWTLLIVVGTGVAGVAILRGQGRHAVDQLRRATQMGRNPAGPVADSALVVLGAVLLILPGFLTDTLGLVLMLPPVRSGIARFVAARVRVASGGQDHAATTRRTGAAVIDGEYFDLTPDAEELPQPQRPPSGWTRH